MNDAPVRRTVDYGALAGAIVIAGLLALPLYLYVVPAAVGAGTAHTVLSLLASVLLGPDVLASAQPLTVGIVLGATAVYATGVTLMAATIAFTLHRWGLVVGIAGGAAFGLVFYALNFYALTWLFEQFHVMAHWSVALVYMALGALAGGIYELLEYDPPQKPGRTPSGRTMQEV